MPPVGAARVHQVLDDRVANRGSGETPAFYAVVGSHAHGTADPNSDVDVRGFHVTPAREYVRVTPPADRHSAETDDLDLISYELHTFGRLLRDADLNAVEAALSPHVVVADISTDNLRNLVRDALPLDVPCRYAGMARSNLLQARENNNPKIHLHALRGVLAATYVREHEDLVLEIHDLSEAILGDDDLVTALVDAKRKGSLDPGLEHETIGVTEELLDQLPENRDSVAKEPFEAEIDQWMLDIRSTFDD